MRVCTDFQLRKLVEQVLKPKSAYGGHQLMASLNMAENALALKKPMAVALRMRRRHAQRLRVCVSAWLISSSARSISNCSRSEFKGWSNEPIASRSKGETTIARQLFQPLGLR